MTRSFHAAAFGGFAALTFAAFPARAETATEEVIVTALRLPAPSEEAPGARVLDEGDLLRIGATTAADVLQTVPGLSVSRQGAFGGVTAVRIRGAASDKTLVLIDGVPLNDPSQPSGGYDFGVLDLADVARIEVLSGPQGSLWGSDAIGGVIAFTTREPDGVRAEAEGGSFLTLRGAAAVGRAREGWAAGLSVSAIRTDGVSAAAGGIEADGHEASTVSANGRVRPAPGVVLDGRLRRTETETDTDGYHPTTFAFGDTADRTRSETWSGHLRLRVDEAFGFRHELLAGAYDLDRVFLAADGSDFAGRAERRVYRWIARRETAHWGLAVGAEREETRASVLGGAADLGATSAFVIVRANPVERLTVTASLRNDAPDDRDGAATARATAAFDLGGGFELSAAYGQGFKTPTVSQLLCDYCFPAGPAFDLKPERAEGGDVRLGWKDGQGRAEASLLLYRLSVRDQIAFAGRYANLDRTRTDGAEAEAAFLLGEAWRLEAWYAYSDAVDRTTGAPLARVPRRSGRIGLFRSGVRSRFGASVRGEGAQADIDPSTFAAARRPGFVTVDLTGALALNGGVEATLRVDNLLDADRQETLGYAEPGRSAYLGLRLRY